jgi:serine protease Do
MENNNNGNNTSNGNGNSQPDSLYSYSYINQENQENNPNYYEKQEEASQGQPQAQARTYIAGGAPGQEPSGDGSRPYATAHNEGQGEPSRDDSRFYTTGQADTSGGQAYGGQDYSSQWNAAKEAGKKESKKPKKASKEKKKHGFGMAVGKCAALALVFGLVSGTVFYGTGLAFKYTSPNNTQLETTTGGKSKTDGTTSSNGIPGTGVSTATTINDVADIVDNVLPSIVSITNMGQHELGRDFFGRSYMEDTESAGSGIIISQTEKEIYIATNNHVVANSTQLTVNFVDNQSVTAEIKGTDPSTDLAVLSVAVSDIPVETMEKIKVATLGNSDDIRVGQGAVAIGNALGYGQSVTTGVISALDREVTVEDENGSAITNDLLQTSAAINPGNSGGALVNMNGEVIGINSVKYNDTRVEGMGFAIPISAAEPIINDLITRELVDEGNSSYLGVSGQDVTESLSEDFGMPEGLYITFVQENSAAEQAGIKNGDVLTEFDGRKITSMDGLKGIMQYYAAGTEVEITIQTNQNGEWQEQKVMATLGKKNN